MDAALAILPIVLVLTLGWGLRVGGLVPAPMWEGIETLSFRVLIPAVLVIAIAGADLGAGQAGPLALALLATLAVGAAGLLAARAVGWLRVPGPVFGAMFQTTLRWNGFIALALARLWSGEAGFAMVAITMAVMIPPINIASILVLAAFGPGKATLRGAALTVLRNPIVQAAVLGLALNLTGTAIPLPLAQALGLVGDAALGIGILAVGAALSPVRLLTLSGRVWGGVALRPLAMPLVFAAVGSALALEPLAMLTGLMAFAVPAATNGYIITRKMGGDAALYADILALQTLVSLALLPFVPALADLLAR